MLSRRDFITSLACAVSAKSLVLTEATPQGSHTRVTEAKTPAGVVLDFNGLVVLGGNETALKIETPVYTCPHTKRKIPERYTNVSVSRVVAPRAALHEIFARYGDVTRAKDNVLTVRVCDGTGEKTVATIDYAVLTQVGVHMTAQDMCVLDGSVDCPAIVVLGEWREQRQILDEYAAAERRYVEAQRADLKASGLKHDGPLNDVVVLDPHWCDDCRDFHA